MKNKLFANIRRLIPYFLFLFSAIFFLILADESRIPVTTTAKHMDLYAGELHDASAVINADSNFSGIFLKSTGNLLDKGSYTLGAAYNTDSAQNALVLYDNGRYLQSFLLDPASTYQEFTFELPASSMDFTYTFQYDGQSYLQVQSVSLIPGQRFYQDTAFLISLLIICFFICIAWKFYSAAKPISIKQNYIILFLLGVGLLSSLPYLKIGLNWAVDLCYHLIRIEGIKDGLLSGQFPVVIYPEAMHGNGYLNCMYPNTFLYIPAILRMMGVSMADSFKFLIILFNFATAFLTYHCVKAIGHNTKAALLASLLYSCAPYRFTNIYARGAVGEFLAMTFFPLIIAGLYYILIGNHKKWGYLALGMTGLLQSHVLSVVIGAVLCALLCILYLKPLLLEKRLPSLIKAVVISILLNLGFLIPFLDFYKNENLWMDALGLGSYQEYLLNLSGLPGIQNTGDYHVLTLGISISVCAVLALCYLILEHTHSEKDDYVQYLFIIGIFFTLMTISFFPAQKMMMIPLIEKAFHTIQFAWRLLGPISLLFTITGCICLMSSRFLKPYQNAFIIALSLLCILSISRFQDEDFGYYSGRDYSVGHESKIVGIPKGPNTVVYPYEWRLKNTIDSGIITDTVISDSTVVSILSSRRNGVTTNLQYSCTESGQYIEIPVLFYMGYRAIDENGNQLGLTYGNNNRIRIPLVSDGVVHSVTITYKIPVIYTLATWISLLTMFLFLVIWIFRRKKTMPLQIEGDFENA